MVGHSGEGDLEAEQEREVGAREKEEPWEP